MLGSMLFAWLQGAHFYRDLHRRAVEKLPVGPGKIWIDAGCGPGLVTRLAAERGYSAKGVDADPSMIKAAKRLARVHRSSAEFEVGNIDGLPDRYADVVSAASLLAVLDDKPSGLNSLWRCVRPGGYLLIIEPTHQMNPENAKKLVGTNLPRKRINGLRIWAAARQNRAVDPKVFDAIEGERKYVDLLHGLVGAWIFKKNDGSLPVE